MNTKPNHNITSERAIDLLYLNEPLKDVYVDGDLIIEYDDYWDKEIVIENTLIGYFSCIGTSFNKPVRITNSHFKNCKLTFCYFLRGLTIDNCLFEDYLDFSSGGHNKTGYSIIIRNNNFKNFVNFFDCFYENDVIITKNKFRKGTNLLGKPHNIPVTFYINPIIKENEGKLDFDHEGEG